MGDIGTCVRNLCGICMGYDGTMHDTMVAMMGMVYHQVLGTKRIISSHVHICSYYDKYCVMICCTLYTNMSLNKTNT